MAVPPRFAPFEERATYGKRLRDVVTRTDQARWQLPADRDVLARLAAAELGRVPELLRVKYQKMATSPFAFLRGGAPVMAPDLAAQPSTGYTVQICGDAHARNLGAYANAEGTIVFDVNDFDETCRGPWEWDLRRLATSIVLVGREADCSESACRDAARATVAAWREAMATFAEMSHVELSRYRVKRLPAGGAVGRMLEKAEQMTPLAARNRLAPLDEDGVPRFSDNRLSEWIGRTVIASLASYRETLDPARQQVFDGYEPYDVAIKIAGTGSLGVRNYMVLCRGNGDDDPLLLQVKQAVPSCYRTLGLVEEAVGHEGQRVAEGAQRCQTGADPFLGWTTIDGLPFVVRRIADHQASIDFRDLNRTAIVEYARVCGETFAKAHARTGDPVILAAYAGNADNLDLAIGDLAIVAADQVTGDYETMLAAISRGQLKAA